MTKSMSGLASNTRQYAALCVTYTMKVCGFAFRKSLIAGVVHKVSPRALQPMKNAFFMVQIPSARKQDVPRVGPLEFSWLKIKPKDDRSFSAAADTEAED